ncbi:MAG: DUF433 domain-containing protein [Hormoscilla sp. GM102CHS1]|nr:DUF433 domain-containing protein [Hormoscilla sp. GM102CHS1]
MVLYKHIQLDDRQVPYIAGTTMKVVELVTSVKAYGWSPEELHANDPHVSRSKIYSALAYYWDNQEEIDAEIERIDRWAEQARREAGESPIVKKLKAQGLLE